MARSTNCKETRRAVEAYVMGCVDDVNESTEAEVGHRPVSAAFDTLRDEMGWQDAIIDDGRRLVGMEYAIELGSKGHWKFISADTPYWVWYLAAEVGHFDVCYDAMRSRLAEWLDETPEEAAKYGDSDVARLYRHLTAVAFERLYEREVTQRRIPTSEFKRILLERHPDNCFFDRKTMRHYHQTMRDIEVYGFFLVTDRWGVVHDCYLVESRQRTDYDEHRETVVSYYDRDTLNRVFTKEDD